jgi:hypothetical protein
LIRVISTLINWINSAGPVPRGNCILGVDHARSNTQNAFDRPSPAGTARILSREVGRESYLRAASLTKATMQQYFLTENKTLDEVIELMEDKFHARYPQSQDFRNSRIAEFVDSKAQYERQFKKWKFRKHRKQHDWASAGRIIKKRKGGGKGSDVYIDGVLIDTKKICKETSRHDRPTYGRGNYFLRVWYGLE